MNFSYEFQLNVLILCSNSNPVYIMFARRMCYAYVGMVGWRWRRTCRFITAFRIHIQNSKQCVSACRRLCALRRLLGRVGGNAFYYIIISTSPPISGFTQKQTRNKELISRPDSVERMRCRSGVVVYIHLPAIFRFTV